MPVPKPAHFPYAIETPRLVLRCYELTDAQAMYEAIEESRDHLAPWLPWVKDFKTLEDGHAAVRRFRGEYDLLVDLKLGVFRQADGRYLGGTGLHRYNWELRRFEIGYWLRTSALRQGYATELTAALTRFCFEQLDARRVEIFVARQNLASRAIPERLGFPLEGIHRNGILLGSEVHDRVVYAMTPEDYAARGWPDDL